MEMARLSYRALLALGILLLVLFIPPLIPFHRFPLTSFWNEWWAGLLVLVAWGIAWFSISKQVVLSTAILPWMVWGAAWMIAAMLANYRMTAPIYWAGLFWIVGALCLIVTGELKRTFGQKQLVSIIAIVLLFSGLFQSILGLLKFYGLLAWFSPFLEPTHDGRMLGLLNYPTIAGFSLWLSFYAALLLFWTRKIGWIGLLLALLPLNIAIIATGNRSSVLYGLCVLGLALIMYVRDRQTDQGRRNDSGSALDRNRMLFSVMAACGLLILLIPVFARVNPVFEAKLDSLGYIHRHTTISNSFQRKKGDFWGIRGSEFRKAVHLAKSHLWTGVGPGNYPYQSFRLDSVLQGTIREGSVNSHSHNIFSMVLAEEGIIGIGALIFGMAMLVFWWWRLGVSAEACFVGAILAAFFAYSNVEYPLWYLNFLVIFLIFCALTAPTVEKRLDSRWVKPTLSILTLVVGAWTANDLANGFNRVTSVQIHDHLNGKNLHTLSAWASDRLIEPFVLLVLERYTFPRPSDIDRQMRLAEKEIHRLPMPKALLDKSMLLEFEGKHGKACSLAERAASSYPHVIDLYGSELQEYASRKEKLPGNPLSLNKCFEAGYEKWKAQWNN